MRLLISIDPGHKKCGLLLADSVSRNVMEGYVVQTNYVINLINSWHSRHEINKIIMGNGTSSRYWQLKLGENNYKDLKLVEEKGSTLRAKVRYWELWPPKSFFRLIPRSMLLPPENLDSIAAMVLLEDYLNKKLVWTEKPSFRTLLE